MTPGMSQYTGHGVDEAQQLEILTALSRGPPWSDNYGYLPVQGVRGRKGAGKQGGRKGTGKGGNTGLSEPSQRHHGHKGSGRRGRGSGRGSGQSGLWISPSALP